MTRHLDTVRDQVLYTIAHAAAAVDMSEPTIRRALRSTDPAAFPPPLRAKRVGSSARPEYRIEADELRRWAASLPDA